MLFRSPDGQIFGFYSAGAVLNPDEGYTANKEGTGTMTNWYLNMGMVFEYLPHKIKDEDGVLQEVTDNKGWREVPFPESWYTSLSEADKADLTASMASGATKRIVSEKDAKALKASITASEGEAWPASYGYITFDEGLPVIHGLHEDDVYWVRFRANDQYEVSKEREIAIGGAVSGGGGETPVASGGLAVNLAGGSEEKDPSGYSDLKTAAKNLGAGEELDLNVYDFEPTRDGSAFLGWTLGERDTDGNLILYRADEPETITVTWVDHDGTVIVEAITVKVGDPLPGHPAENPTREGYTFDQWVRSEDGEGNVTFTATYTEVTEPEPTPTPTPDPESPAARDGEGDGEVTDPGEGGGEGEEPPPVTPTPPVGTAAIWVDGLTGETILEGTTETEAPKKPFHSCYTAAEEWTEVTGEDGTVTYTITYTRNTKVPMPETTPASLAAVWQGGSDPDPSDFASIVFYDWDGTTNIGAIIVYGGISQDGLKASIQEFVDQHEDTFKSKRGYIFENIWLPLDSTIPTRYGRYLMPGTNTLVADSEIAAEAQMDFTTLKAGTTLLVKAAYKGSLTAEADKETGLAEMPNNAGAIQNRYTVTADSYNRLGTAQIYSVTFKIERAPEDKNAVPRAASPVLRLQTASSGGAGYINLILAGNDVDYATVTVPSSITQISGYVVDDYQYPNWVGALARSATISVYRDDRTSGGKTTVGYYKQGILGYVNDQLAMGDAANFSVADLSNIGIDTKGLELSRLKEILTAAWADKKDNLTVEEVQAAINKASS